MIIYTIRNSNHSPVKYIPVILHELSAMIQHKIQEGAKSPAEMNIRRFPSLIIVSHCLLYVPLDNLDITENYFTKRKSCCAQSFCSFDLNYINNEWNHRNANCFLLLLYVIKQCTCCGFPFGEINLSQWEAVICSVNYLIWLKVTNEGKKFLISYFLSLLISVTRTWYCTSSIAYIV